MSRVSICSALRNIWSPSLTCGSFTGPLTAVKKKKPPLIRSLSTWSGERDCKALTLPMPYWFICQESGIHSQFSEHYTFDCVILKNKQSVHSSLALLCFELHLRSRADLQLKRLPKHVSEILIEYGVKWGLVAVAKVRVCLCIRKSATASWEIGHASAEDEGLYECIAQSNAGQGRALSQLTVRGTSHAHMYTSLDV